MNFFERQQVARRNSRWLVVLFVLAVVCIAVAVDIVARGAWFAVALYMETPSGAIVIPRWLHALALGGTAALILAVSVRKTMEMGAGGGIAVARMMDARQVVPVRATEKERQLLNVVEEMAIASGIRVPLVYVLDAHRGINAFAAGGEGSLPVVVVTRGCVEALNRDELQGVIGHEFSHIVNGDMALNVRMIGVLAGIVVIGKLGEFLLRLCWRPGDLDTRVKVEVETDIRIVILVTILAVILYVIGYLGLFFGRLIKAMVAREREFLADAGSAQFTRNPEGLAGALDQVKRSHSFVVHVHAEDISHLFFAEAIYLEEERWLSTHPPLLERIHRLAPGFRAAEYRDRRVPAPPPVEPLAAMAGNRASDSATAWTLTSGEAAGLVGTVAPRDVTAARALLAALPDDARAAIATADGARALILALMLSADDALQAAQLAKLRAAGFGELADAAEKMKGLSRTLPLAWHLPVVDLALPELRADTPARRDELVRALDLAVQGDRRVSVYRFAYLTFVRAQLGGAVPRKPGSKSLPQLRTDAALVLSLVAHAGCGAAAASGAFPRAFEAGAAEMELKGWLAPVAREQCDPQSAALALQRLADLAPLAKARLVKGLFAAVTADGCIRIVEAALMRMICAVLECPLPPLMNELTPEKLAA